MQAKPVQKIQTLLSNSPIAKRIKRIKEEHPAIGKKIDRIFNSNSRLVAPAFILLALLIITGGYFLLDNMVGSNKSFTVSGTIEVTEIHLGSEVGGRVDRVTVHEGDLVQPNQVVAEVHGDKVHAPVQGTVLVRAAEPGEIVGLGGTLVTIGNLDDLTLTVYVPEDRYGAIMLGQNCDITVDSFPERVFKGKVANIASKAEFTPRNVQTTDSRKTTVFAIRLDLEPSGGLLKPGMPADVHFQNNY
ncbi:MAG: efflux RND transporter periplasmic adaptor subunit [Anaerolineae bacterium]|nr:efflux RND transporter periplasmic adaptor subunit [Anaerolineae bacterium]